MKRAALLIGVGVALAVAWLWGLPGGLTSVSRQSGVSATPQSSEHVTGESASAGPARTPLSVHSKASSENSRKAGGKRRRPASLRGTDVDGALFVDEAGHFHATTDAIEMFEYFFAATGEESYEDIVARIVAAIHKRLGPVAAREAIAFLERYLDYRKRAGALDGEAVAGESLLTRFERLRALRRQIFGEELAAKLFGTDEAYARTRLQQQQVAEDQSLSEEERRRRIEELNRELMGQLPEEAIAARERSLAPLKLIDDEARLREQGATDEEVHALRVERFGEEAAGRLAELDRSRAHWQSRLDEYRETRRGIETDPSLSSQERSRAVEGLLADSFSDTERRRVAALDRMADADSGP